MTRKNLWGSVRYLAHKGCFVDRRAARQWARLIDYEFTDDEWDSLLGDLPENIRNPALSPSAIAMPPSYYVTPQDAMRKLGDIVVAQDGHGQWPIVITGMGGVGKSTLLKAFLRQEELGDRFDGVLWADLAENGVWHWQEQWARNLEIKLEGEDVERRRQKLAACLENKSLLIAIDDVWQAQDVEMLLVGGCGCRTLITTRQELDFITALRIDAGRSVTVNPITDPEMGLQFFRGHLGSLSEQEEAYVLEMVKLLEGLPLAMEIVGGLVRVTGRRWNDILDDLRDRTYLPETPLGTPKRRYHSVQVALQLGCEYLDPESLRQFRLLGALAQSPFGVEMVGALWDSDRRATKLSLLDLVGRNMLQTAGEERYRMHELVYRFAKIQMSEDEQAQGYRTLATYMKRYLGELVEQLARGGMEGARAGRAGFECEWPHIMELGKQAEERKDWETEYQLWMTSAIYQEFCGRWSESEKWAQQLLDRAGKWNLERRTKISIGLGQMLIRTCQYCQAVSLLNDLLPLRLHTENLMMVYMLLAEAHLGLYDFDQADKYLKKASPLLDQVPEAIGVLTSLRAGFEERLGNWDAAFAFRNLALERASSVGDTVTATQLIVQQADLCLKGMQFEQALQLYRQAADKCRDMGAFECYRYCLEKLEMLSATTRGYGKMSYQVRQELEQLIEGESEVDWEDE